MAVYVGVPMWPFRNMIMCHMFADTEKELDDLAQRLGMRPEWKQKPDRPAGRISGLVHYDIAKSKRAQAIKMGAVACDTLEEEIDALERVASA